MLIQPRNVSVTESEKLVLKCGGLGQPIFDIMWYKNNELITSPFTNFTNGNTNSRNGSLIIPATNITDEGFYTCVLKNDLGSVTSMAAWIDVQCKRYKHIFLIVNNID